MHEDKGLEKELASNPIVAMPDVELLNRADRRARKYAVVHIGSHKQPLYKGKRRKLGG